MRFTDEYVIGRNPGPVEVDTEIPLGGETVLRVVGEREPNRLEDGEMWRGEWGVRPRFSLEREGTGAVDVQSGIAHDLAGGWDVIDEAANLDAVARLRSEQEAA